MGVSKTFKKEDVDNLESGIYLLVEDLIDTDDQNTSLLYIRGDEKEDIATVMMCGYPEELADILFEFMEDDEIFQRFIKRIHSLENKRRLHARNNKHPRKTIRG